MIAYLKRRIGTIIGIGLQTTIGWISYHTYRHRPMPTRLCLEPRCANPSTYRGRCPDHARTTNQATHRNRTIYNSKRWQQTRRRVLHEQPLCPCGHIATDVDHITAIEAGGNPWARHNLQALCAQCHGRKTRQEQQHA